jgi:ATP phosphoribosyltransferase regulatory subunit
VPSPSPIRLPAGVRDFLPPAAARRRAIAEALLGEFERWGYDRIITPAFEYLDVLARGLGDGARAAALRFVEPGTGEVVALRPDITPQIARVAATRLGESRGPVRLAYEGSVLRMAGARGQRELIQAGVELIDGPSPAGDAEVIALAAAALAAAEVDGATLDVGHVALARGALAAVPDRALAAELEALLARKDEEGIARAAHRRVPPRAARLLSALPSLHGAPADVLSAARALPLDRAMRAALDELEAALEGAHDQGAPASITVDLGEARGSSYYTGVRFAGYVAGVGDAILLGGRYDDLVGRYGRPARATGFAVDVEAVAQAERGREAPAARGVLLSCTGDRACGRRAHRIAATLRHLGVRVAIDLDPADGEPPAAAAEVTLVCDGRAALARGKRVAQAALAAAAAGDGAALLVALGISRKGKT